MSNTTCPLELEREELKLKWRAELQEYFILQDSPESGSRTRQLSLLQERIEGFEKDLVKIDRAEAARSYREHLGLPTSRQTEVSSKPAEKTLSPSHSDPTIVELDACQRSSPRRVSPPKRLSQLGSVSHSPKRIKLAVDDEAPCLRCKVLKKKCDSLERCAHCPHQSLENQNDYWKIIGCTRGNLRGMADIFCPEFGRANPRILNCKSGKVLTIDFILTKSKVSLGKKRRIRRLVETRRDFAELHNSSWETLNIRESLCRLSNTLQAPGAGDRPVHNDFPCEHYEAAWALVQVAGMDQAYSGKTKYNPFNLLRLGNGFLNDAPYPWEIFRKSTQLLRQAVEIYLLERLCSFIAAGDVIDAPFDPTRLPSSNTLVLVDMKEDMEDFLQTFDKICAGRSKLSGDAQLACFYALLVFSITKSLLIDAYSVRTSSEYVARWNGAYALRVNSAYKILASVFSWASKSDIMLHQANDTHVGDTEAMVHVSRWEDQGFKTTKDFLLSLGSFVFPDGTYNGFFVQKFGLESLPKFQLGCSGSDTDLNGSHGTRGAKTMTPLIQNHSKPTYKIHMFSMSSDQSAAAEKETSPESPSTLSPDPDSPESGKFDNSRFNSTSNTPQLPVSTEGHCKSFTFVDNGYVASRSGLRRLCSGRRGALDEATSKKAREIRKIGACWNCWVLKVPCSEGHPCDRCGEHYLCNRSPFAAHCCLFFPDIFNNRFTAEVMEQYIKENIVDFNEPTLPIEIYWIGHSSMKLHATPFTCAPYGTANDRYPGQSSQSLGVESLLVGLSQLDISKAEQDCMGHFESLLESPSSPNFTNGMSMFSERVMKAVYSYYHSEQPGNLLLHDALLFHSILNTMSRPVMLTATSVASIVEKLNIPYPQSESFSSRMLDRQIKQILYTLNRKIATRLLSSLEKLMRSRNVSYWPLCFSTILMLCISMEQVQIQLKFYANGLRLSPSWSVSSTEEAYQACRLLDDLPFAQLAHLFHSIYRTKHVGKGGLNPLWGDTEEHQGGGFNTAALTMIKNIRSILDDVSHPPQGNRLPDFDQGLGQFTKGNSGRLVSRFLVPFIKQEPTTRPSSHSKCLTS